MNLQHFFMAIALAAFAAIALVFLGRKLQDKHYEKLRARDKEKVAARKAAEEAAQAKIEERPLGAIFKELQK